MPDAFPTHEQVTDLLNYNPDTGIFIWKKTLSRRAMVGAVAGTNMANGYRLMSIFRKRILAHRLAWFYIHSIWPEEIDHINRDRSDNRIANLRLANRSQNNANGKIRDDNKSGVRGVSWDTARGKWTARVIFNRRVYFLGRFDTKEAATHARVTKAREIHGEFVPMIGA